MLKYGKAYLEQNERILNHYKEVMGQRAYDVAIEMGPHHDEDEEIDDSDHLTKMVADLLKRAEETGKNHRELLDQITDRSLRASVIRETKID